MSDSTRTAELRAAVAHVIGILPNMVEVAWSMRDGEPYPEITIPPLGFIVAQDPDDVRKQLQAVVLELRKQWARATVRSLDAPDFAARMRARRA